MGGGVDVLLIPGESLGPVFADVQAVKVIPSDADTLRVSVVMALCVRGRFHGFLLRSGALSLVMIAPARYGGNPEYPVLRLIRGPRLEGAVYSLRGMLTTLAEDREYWAAFDARTRADRVRAGWSERHLQAVARREVLIGMTRDMVRAARGAPLRQHRTETARGVTEVWVYSVGGDYLHVRFEAGRVAELQSGRE